MQASRTVGGPLVADELREAPARTQPGACSAAVASVAVACQVVGSKSFCMSRKARWANSALADFGMSSSVSGKSGSC